MGILVFLGVLGLIFAIAALGARAAEGPPRRTEDGFVTRGGGWVGGLQASWPFVELRVTPERIEIRPASAWIRFSTVTVTRADQVSIRDVWSPLGRGLRFDGPALDRRVTFWPLRRREVRDALAQMAWPVGEYGPVTPVTGAHVGVAVEPVEYRPSWTVFAWVPLSVLWLGWVVVLGIWPFALFGLVLFGWQAITVVDRLVYDGREVRCRTLLWHHRIAARDVEPLTVPPTVGRFGMGTATITGRGRPRLRVQVLSRGERARYRRFLGEVAAIGPDGLVRG